jgi:hypothetical protein
MTENVLDNNRIAKDEGCLRMSQTIQMFAGTAAIIREAPFAIAAGRLRPLLYGRWIPVPADFKLSESAGGAFRRLRTGIEEQPGLKPQHRSTLLSAWKVLEIAYLEAAYLVVTGASHVNHFLKFAVTLPVEYRYPLQRRCDWAIILYTLFVILTVRIESTWSVNRNYGNSILGFARKHVRSSLQHQLDWAEERFHEDLQILLGSKQS